MAKSRSRKRTGSVYIGTSGWVYKSWHKKFYPKEIKKDFLSFYSRHYNSVEVNTSFYHLPKKSTFEKWKNETPGDFVFSVKMSRYVTHIERIKDVREPLKRFFASASGMAGKIVVVLVQLPPSLRYSEKVFAKFLKDLDGTRKIGRRKVRIAFEPRHASWFDADNIAVIRSYAKKYKMALVFAHSAVFPKYEPIKDNIIADYVYVRFHGPKEFAMSQYGRRRLLPWAKLIKSWRNDGKTVFAYFNDDAHGYAIKDAKILMDLIPAR